MSVAENHKHSGIRNTLGDALPHVIHTETENEPNEHCTALLESILRKAGRTAEESRAELLTY